MEAHKHQTFTYKRRRPQDTPCYQIVQNHLETFLAQRQLENRPLPLHVVTEFNEYLKCGILAHGFIRLKCDTCDEEKVTAFSCKKRGFCPSCCAKRQAEAAAHLVDDVLPLAPYRQFVLSFPIPLRYWININKKLYARIHKIAIKEIHRYYIEKAKELGIKAGVPGTISFTQRFGSSLNLNPHMHVLALDGVYTKNGETARLHTIKPITDDEVATLVDAIAEKVLKHLKKKGYLDKNGEVVLHPDVDPLFAENEALILATQSSIAGKIAFGPNTGKYVTRIGSGFGYEEETPLIKGKRCASLNGFSLHCNTAVNTHQRDRLEKLISYIARGPLSNERLEIKGDKVLLQLKTPWKNGVTHLELTHQEFIEKLVALTPPPKTHLVRWAGVFAPNSALRKLITLKPEAKKGFDCGGDKDELRKNYTWSKMLARVFKIDVLNCDHCGGRLSWVCAVHDPDSIKRYLKHIGEDYDAPARAPPQTLSESFDFEHAPNISIEPSIHYD